MRLWTHAHLRDPAGPGQVSAASRPREVQVHIQRLRDLLLRGRLGQPRQGLGADSDRLLATGLGEVRRLRILQVQVR